MSYYTSYETSAALKDAGAPQGLAEKAWYRSETRKASVIVNSTGAAEESRAFRLDEILGALEAAGEGSRPCLMPCDHDPTPHWTVIMGDHAEPAATPVEAAAACWIAVLRAAREARP